MKGSGVRTACLAIGVLWGISFGMLALSAASPGRYLSAWAEPANVLLGVLPWPAIIWLLLAFSSGSLAGRWERISALGVAVSGAVFTFGFPIEPRPIEETGQASPLDEAVSPRPLALTMVAALAGISFDPGTGFFVVLIVAVGAVGLIRDGADGIGVVRGWVGAVLETMQPCAAGVWFRATR